MVMTFSALLRSRLVVSPVARRGWRRSVTSVLLLAACGGEPRPAVSDSVVTVNPFPEVTLSAVAPASYEGILPCADCSGLKTVLAIWPDSVYRLAQTYEGKSTTPVVTMGRWRLSESVLSLETENGIPILYRRAGDDTLTLLDQQGQPIASALNYSLRRSVSMNSLREPARFIGTFEYMADTPTFRECGSGQTYPVLMQGAYRTLERAFLAAKLPPGSGQQVEVRARFLERPADMEGPRDRDVVEIVSYVGPSANPGCR